MVQTQTSDSTLGFFRSPPPSSWRVRRQKYRSIADDLSPCVLGGLDHLLFRCHGRRLNRPHTQDAWVGIQLLNCSKPWLCRQTSGLFSGPTHLKPAVVCFHRFPCQPAFVFHEFHSCALSLLLPHAAQNSRRIGAPKRKRYVLQLGVSRHAVAIGEQGPEHWFGSFLFEVAKLVPEKWHKDYPGGAAECHSRGALLVLALS